MPRQPTARALAWCASVLALTASLGCATPPRVKEASAAQVDLIRQAQKSLQAIRTTVLAEMPRFDPNIADALEQMESAPNVPKALKFKLPELKAELAGLEEAGTTPPVTVPEPGRLADAVAAGGELQFVEVLSLQLDIMRRASTVTDRYLATDVFGDEELEQTYELVTQVQETLK